MLFDPGVYREPVLCSFRDRQGADVAPLVRCVRDWLAAGELQCVGTSATLTGAGTFVERKAAVAKMTSQVFGTTVKPEHVTGETLVRTLELTYTAWDLEPFAKNCGYNGPPFRRNEERRFLLRCEVGATYFHLHGIECDDIDYIMETFPIVTWKDDHKHSDYRTKRVILESYNEMRRVMKSEELYKTRLEPLLPIRPWLMSHKERAGRCLCMQGNNTRKR